MWKSVGEGPDLPCNETEIVPKKKGVRNAVRGGLPMVNNSCRRGQLRLRLRLLWVCAMVFSLSHACVADGGCVAMVSARSYAVVCSKMVCDIVLATASALFCLLSFSFKPVCTYACLRCLDPTHARFVSPSVRRVATATSSGAPTSMVAARKRNGPRRHRRRGGPDGARLSALGPCGAF